MWSSIEQIIKPDNFNDAQDLNKQTGSVLFAGGSYLVADRDNNTQTLLDINHLLSDQIKKQADRLQVGAGSSLQKLLKKSDSRVLSQAIISSCSSKNIRNQRTLGGEIARGRTDSDLLIYLHVAGATLQINESNQYISLQDWQGDGVISNVFIPENDTRLERVAVLDSAPAFVIVAVNQGSDSISLAVGGKSERILSSKISLSLEEPEIQKFMARVKTVFHEDHFGTPSYKQHLVSNLLSDMMEAE
ncbi:FAD binding domain-containing protein [bacterium]|nr:FAD binding domain-containing protein [bacterium]